MARVTREARKREVKYFIVADVSRDTPTWLILV
jgi:hypothetical protein